MRIVRILIIAMLVIGVLLMGFAGYRMIETNRVYQGANAAYGDLSSQVRKASTPRDKALPETGGFANSSSHQPEHGHENNDSDEQGVYVPGFDIDFEVLHSMNKDSAAWLYSPNTVIDYPVMRADDYTYYLNHLSDGTVNANGSLFIDYNNSPDFSDDLTVIYGHHMKSGSMFGSLKGYKEQSYFDANPYMYLYTPDGDYRIDLLYGCLIAAGQWSQGAFMYSENLDELLSYSRNNTTFISEATYTQGDRIIALSTCSYEFDDARYVVIGVLRPSAKPMTAARS